MFLISHRGNTNGPNPAQENNPNHIFKLLHGNDYLHVEVDLWYLDNKWYSGHDEPKYPISLSRILMNKKRMWLHCKNLEALDYMVRHYADKLNYFWHEEDKYTLTSNGFIWTYPNQPTCKKSILVVLNKKDDLVYRDQITNREIEAVGICTDYPSLY